MYCLGVVALTLPGMRLPNTKKGTPGTPASSQPRASKSSSHGGDAADGHPRVKNDRLAEPVFFSASVLYTRVTIWRRTLAARTKMLGEAHPDTAEAMRELALALRSSRATEYRREGLALDQKLKMLSAKPQAEKQPRTRRAASKAAAERRSRTRRQACNAVQDSWHHSFGAAAAQHRRCEP